MDRRKLLKLSGAYPYGRIGFLQQAISSKQNS
jgi:hypothetical protein